MKDIAPFKEAHRRLEAELCAGHSWLRQLRHQAMERLAVEGLPNREMEAWRYTDPSWFVRRPFKLPKSSGLLEGGSVSSMTEGLECIRLVFVNGRLDAHSSHLPPLPKGVMIRGMQRMLEEEPEMLHASLERLAAEGGEGFYALNEAFWMDGLFIHVPEGIHLSIPIHVLYVSTCEDGSSIPVRLIVRCGEAANVSLIESVIGESNAFYNAVVDIELERRARLEHFRLHKEGDAMLHFVGIRVHQGEESRYASHLAAFSGALSRVEIQTKLTQRKAACHLNGLYLADRRRHVDCRLVVDHQEPDCASDLLYKGVLNGQGRAVFCGKVMVQPGAVKTNARQFNGNLLLSPSSQVDSMPQFEIYADDVQCSHGACVGQIDEEALFYLRSRGIEEAQARDLLTFAFADDVLSRFSIGAVRQELERYVLGHLPLHTSLEGLV